MATADSKAAPARTRSQTTLNDFFAVNLSTSPLKHARRHVAATAHDDPHLKRPPSPAKDAALLGERELKRPRHGVFPPPKPSSLPPDPSASTALPPRAKSVPPLPLLDLNNVPPSPRRSPAKFRIASVPPEQPPTSPPHPPPKSPTFTFVQATPAPHDSMTPMSPLTPLPPSGDNTVDTLLSTQPPPPLPLPAPVAAPHREPASRQSTSFIPRASGVRARMRPKGASTAAAVHPAPSKKVKNPRDRDGKNSILGGLMSSVKPTPAQSYKRAQSQPPTPSYLLPTTSSVARASPVKPAFVVSRPAPGSRSMSRGPPALPQLQLEQPPETSEGNAQRPPETSEDKLEREHVATREEPELGPLSPLTSVTSEADEEETLSHPEAPGQDALPSHPQIEDGGERTDDTEPDQPPESSEPALAPAAGPAPLTLNSSLSTLTEALERLNAPPPSRPQTSLGFHRAAPGMSDMDSSEASDAGAGADPGVVAGSGGRGGRGGRGRGRGRGGKAGTLALDRPRPSTAMSMSSLPTAATPATKGKAVAVPDSTPGQKKLKQTTLMLPPPVPGGTRTTRLRAAALAAANAAASSSSPAVLRTPAKEGGALRQGVLTLAKPKSMAPSESSAAGPRATASSSTATAKVASTSTSSSSKPLTSTFLRPGSTLAKPVFGLGALGGPSSSSTKTTTTVSRLTALRGRFGGTRVTQRVSKASSLPVVVGSPVKGGKEREAMDVDVAEEDLGPGGDTLLVEEPEGGDSEMSTKDKIGEWLKNASKDVLRDLGHLSDEEDGIDSADAGTSLGLDGTARSAAPGAGASNSIADADADVGVEKAKAKEREARRNASRRASMASHLLSQSLSALPSTVTPDKGKDVKGKGRAVSSTYPAAVASTPTNKDKDGGDGADSEGGQKKSAVPPAPRAHATRLATGALSTPPNAYKDTGMRSSASQEGSGKGKGKASGEGSPARLGVLKDCRIFVDVRTDEGDDAGGLFVEMLESLGAKIASKVGSRCTHVVYKNGLMSTLSRYKLLSDPKPHVVGIAWVVECAEQCKKVDEGLFHVNLDLVNVAGVNKRRKSYLPKHVSPVKLTSAASPTSSDSLRAGVGTMLSMGVGGPPPRSTPAALANAAGEDGDSSMQMGPPAGNGEDDSLESLPPLERARRRKSMLPSR